MIEQTIRRQGVRDTLRADNIFMNFLLLGPNLGKNRLLLCPNCTFWPELFVLNYEPNRVIWGNIFIDIIVLLVLNDI